MTWCIDTSICNDCPLVGTCVETKLHQALNVPNGSPEMYSKYHGVTKIGVCSSKVPVKKEE